MKLTLSIDQRLKNLKRLKKNLQQNQLQEILEGIGMYMVSSIQKNFEPGGRPNPWKPLKPATLKRKKETKILVESGNLVGGIAYEIEPNQEAVYIGPSGPSTVYAPRHNFGDKGNFPIPQRQFLLIQEEDLQYIETFTQSSIF